MESIKKDNSIGSQILRDIKDGVIVIDKEGKIIFSNPATNEILDIHFDIVGKEISEIIPIEKEYNDDFNEIIIEATMDKEHTHHRKIKFKQYDDDIVILDIRSSYFHGDENLNKEGIIIEFSNITEEENLQRKVYDSALSFIVLLGGLSVWIFIYGLYIHFNAPFHINILTNILLLLSGAMFLIFRKFTTLSLTDVGLGTKNLKHNLFVGCIITAIGFIIMIFVKLILMKLNPSQFIGKPFFDFSRFTWEEVTYLISVVWQEFITRGIVHQSLRRVIPGKHGEALALIMTALFFGALHIHMGVYYMFGAAILLGILGFLYIKQGSIWGTCIPHYFLSISLLILNIAI